MTEEIIADNKAAAVVGDNKPTEVKEANLPSLKEEVVEKPKAPQDPDYEKWAKETGNLENAYHRVKGSAAEVEKWRKEAEDAKTYREKYDQISQELQFLAKTNPKLAQQIQNSLANPAEEEQPDNKVIAELPPEDKKLLDNLRFREAEEAKRTITSFRKSFQGYIQNEDQWEAIREHAKSLDGKKDINGNFYTLKTALQASIRAEMPQVISDKATLETYASTANRDSAAEAGDTAFGRTTDATLSPEEEAMVKRFSQFGATREGYLKRKTQHS